VSTLYLIRHGQASYGVANYDKLSPLGIKQARAVGVALAGPMHEPLDAVYAGPLVRQRTTAEHMREACAEAGRELPAIIELPELSEYPAFELLRHWVPKLAEEDPAFAALAGEGAEQQDMIALLDRAFDHVIGRWGRGEIDTPGVESIAEFTARVRRALEIITKNHGRGTRVAAVTSGGVIGAALHLALELAPVRTLDLMKMVRNASISELAFRPGQLSVIAFNSVHHLGAIDMLTFR
jgi:broad specificity phosphatase PhoE